MANMQKSDDVTGTMEEMRGDNARDGMSRSVRSSGFGVAKMSDISDGIDRHAVPSGTGCVECLATGQWWFHLRRCAKCGHIGCCDTSPNRHATAHFRETGHFIITSFEPGEDWFWNYRTSQAFHGPRLSPPSSRPLMQPAPGPEGRVPEDWEDHLNNDESS